jgi:hypothetical protein
MSVYKVVRYYRPVEDVYIDYKCGECGTNQSIKIKSHAKDYKAFCKACNAINEIEIIVCPECNSSRHVIETNSRIKVMAGLDNIGKCEIVECYRHEYKCEECDIVF